MSRSFAQTKVLWNKRMHVRATGDAIQHDTISGQRFSLGHHFVFFPVLKNLDASIATGLHLRNLFHPNPAFLARMIA